MSKPRKPVCVITGDIHFTLNTLDLAAKVVYQGLSLSKELNVPFVMNGDTLDTKAIIRGEVANRLVEILDDYEIGKVFINTGNHDKLNERSDASSLNFLTPYATVIKSPVYVQELSSTVVPYYSDNEALQKHLATQKEGDRLIMHQGIMGADLGHYVKDSSSLPKESFANFRTVLSHYHKRQDIKCGRPRKGAVGLASYVGSPYSISFAEAHDGPKGINILYDDGSLELVPTNLRKHVVVETTTDKIKSGWVELPHAGINKGDLVWVKVSGPSSALGELDRKRLAEFVGMENFKLEKIAVKGETDKKIAKVSGLDLFDKVVDQTSGEAEDERKIIKEVVREILS